MTVEDSVTTPPSHRSRAQSDVALYDLMLDPHRLRAPQQKQYIYWAGGAILPLTNISIIDCIIFIVIYQQSPYLIILV